MRSLKLGLSKPKSKKKPVSNNGENQSQSNADVSELDEINVSRDTIDSISSLHLKKSVKVEPHSVIDNATDCDLKDINVQDESLLDLVNKVTVKHELKVADAYDIQNKYFPEAGTSNANVKVEKHNVDISLNMSCDSSIDDDDEKRLGIMSFYNTSKFNISLDKTLENSIITAENCTPTEEKNYVEVIERNDTETKLLDQNSLISSSKCTVLTPKIRPPTKNYIISSLENYSIPKMRNPMPYYSDPNDVGDKVEIGQLILKLQSKSSRDQKAFDKVLDTTSIEEWRQLLFLQTNEMTDECSKPDGLKKLLSGNKQYILEPFKKPPTTNQVKKYLETRGNDVKDETITNHDEISKNVDELDNSQVIGLNDEIENSISLESNEKVS